MGEDQAVVQLVSTGEALMERRIAEIPASEWDDLSIDLTPREYVLDFLEHAFPVQLQEPFEDDDGNLMSGPSSMPTTTRCCARKPSRSATP